MAGRLIIDAYNPALDANGQIDTGATLGFFLNRTDTPQAIYADAALVATLENPLSPDSSGRFPQIWGPDGAVYSVEWTPTGENAITFNDIALAADPVQPELYEHVSAWVNRVLADGETIIRWNVPNTLVLPEDLNDGVFPSIFTIATNPTATLELKIYKNSDQVGSLSFSTSGVCTVTFTEDAIFLAGDQFSVDGPATHDVTGAGLALTFVFGVP